MATWMGWYLAADRPASPRSFEAPCWAAAAPVRLDTRFRTDRPIAATAPSMTIASTISATLLMSMRNSLPSGTARRVAFGGETAAHENTCAAGGAAVKVLRYGTVALR